MATTVTLHQIRFRSGKWWAYARLHSDRFDRTLSHVEASYSEEPTEAQAIADFQTYADDWEAQLGRTFNPLNRLERVLEPVGDHLRDIWISLINGIVATPEATFDQAVAGLEAAFPNSPFRMQELLLQVQTIFEIADWIAFKQWVLDRVDEFDETEFDETEFREVGRRG